MQEQYLIEAFCEDTGEWVPVEVNPFPYPRPGGDGEELASAGALYRWTHLKTDGEIRDARILVG